MRHTAVVAGGLVVMWSSGFVGARLGTDHAAADTLLAWRYVVVAVLLGLFAVVRRPRVTAFEVRRQAVLGVLCQVLYLAGVVGGVGIGVPAGVAALIAVMQPLVVGALAGPVLGERVRPRQWLGLVTGLSAVAVVVAGDLGGGGHVLGYLLVAGGMLALSAGTLLERRWALRTAPFDQLTIHCLASCGVFVVAAAATGRLAPPMTPGFWWAVVWVVVLSTFGGYGCYLLTLRALGATGVSTMLFLTPPTTMVWALLMFGDPIAWTTVIGLAGCAVAVWLVLARSGTASPEPVRASSIPRT
ncbi:DMT family transporter [Actinophytocola gossypii]|uniref:DMT family transporter n=1 Tax=Actinophytocola gossypii TaxID=2812003 RepID=A0ABT2J835_9PSEU|nr:DMT family transporter [Actinophytocola gossypii]MCT2583645.1 DMT family transporter [Actinophytocola gossypii]